MQTLKIKLASAAGAFALSLLMISNTVAVPMQSAFTPAAETFA